MKIVIQCAASKHDETGFLQMPDGRPIIFVARPELAPQSDKYVYCHPDEPTPMGNTLRDELIAYNQSGDNSFELKPAHLLYKNASYVNLAEEYGKENIYILSAGWGLIAADYLTPVYDITFSNSAEKYKRRSRRDKYLDMCMLQPECRDDLIFFGGKDYLQLFHELTKNYPGRRVVFYNSKEKPQIPDCSLVKYETATRTNWHYECVKSFINGELMY
jgi:hypothetical protein